MPSPTAKKTAAKKAAGSKTSRANVAGKVKAEAAAPGETGGKGEGLLRAGLKVLGGQTRVVESLLGIPAATARQAMPAVKKNSLEALGETLGFRKLEDVFDQRIATALERLGMPSVDELNSLREQVRQLVAERDKALAAASTRRKR